MPYLTPDLPPANDFICRRLRIPNEPGIIAIVNGALTELCRERNFEAFGTLPIYDTIQLFMDMFIDYTESDACMLGAIMPFATVTAPDGWLECDGAIYERANYPHLVSVLHPDLLVGLDEFRTPDLSGRFIMGGTGDAGFFPAHEIGGEETVTLTENEMPSHSHTDSGHFHLIHGHLTGLALAPGELPVDVPNPLGGATANASANILPTGGGDAHNNLPPFYTLRYFIAYR